MSLTYDTAPGQIGISCLIERTKPQKTVSMITSIVGLLTTAMKHGRPSAAGAGRWQQRLSARLSYP
jgi:hypothetical protein